MLFNYRTSNRCLNLAIYISIFILVNIGVPKTLDAEELTGKKAIILVIDNISLNELVNSNTPNFHALMERGGVAQMNIRPKSSLANRGSSYLSLALGVRTLSSTKGGLAFDRSELVLTDHLNITKAIRAEELYSLYTGQKNFNGQVVNLGIEDSIRASSTVTTSNFSKLFGQRAKELGLITGIVGNSDTNIPKRESTILAMDWQGQIPYGSVSSELLKLDKEVLGGIRTDEEKLLNAVDKVFSKVDILFIDYGDTVRIQENYTLAKDSIKIRQKLKALERADAFIGKILKKLDLNNTLFMVISPNPSREAIRAGNFGLTPVILTNPELSSGPGLLTSKTTRREGLVTNLDFAPTIFHYFEKEGLEDYLGGPIELIQLNNPIERILQEQNILLSLRKNRSVFHILYITAVMVALLLLVLPINLVQRKLKKTAKSLILFVILAFPIPLITVSKFGYNSIIFDLVYVILGAMIIATLVSKIRGNVLIGVVILALFTSLLLLLDVYTGGKLMIASPLGSDAIAGGRFYGMGNDYMGILLGSSILGLFTLYQLFTFSKAWMSIVTILLLSAVAIGLSPIFGANVGGTLSALVICILSIIIINDKNISFSKVILVILSVTLIIVGVAFLDAYINPNPTHAGKAIISLLAGGWSRFIEIVSYKLGQVSWNLRNANWNIVLFLEISLIWLLGFKKEYFEKLSVEIPKLYQGLKTILLGALVVFLFNDTGTIASALMLIYAVFPLVVYDTIITKLDS